MHGLCPGLKFSLLRHRKLRRRVNVAGLGLVEALGRARLDLGFMAVVVRAELVPIVVDSVVVLRVIVFAGAGGGGTASATESEEFHSALG